MGPAALADPSALVWLAPLVDGVLAVFLIEMIWLWLRRRALLACLMPNLVAGLSLTLALRLALEGAGGVWIVALLAAAGICHGLDWLVRVRESDTSTTAP